VLDSRLQAAGVSAAQVAVVWLKEADAGPTSDWPAHAQLFQREIETMLQLLKQRFPNPQIAYLSSRIYAGYATSTLNPEPYAYGSAFSVRGVIQDQQSGQGGIDHRSGQAPWAAWGPYSLGGRPPAAQRRPDVGVLGAERDRRRAPERHRPAEGGHHAARLRAHRRDRAGVVPQVASGRRVGAERLRQPRDRHRLAPRISSGARRCGRWPAMRQSMLISTISCNKCCLSA
jgi:hypothetical protein